MVVAAPVLLVDFDGTLIDSVPALKQAYLQFLAARGKRGSQQEFASLNGIALQGLVENLKQRHGLPGTVEALCREYANGVERIYTQEVALMPGAERVLHRAKDHGTRLAVVTASDRSLVTEWLKRNAIEKLFDALVTAEGLRVSKPDPAIYIKALEIMRASSENAIAIEDSPYGVTAALRAAIPTIALGAEVNPRLLDRKISNHLLGCVGGWHEAEGLLFTS